MPATTLLSTVAKKLLFVSYEHSHCGEPSKTFRQPAQHPPFLTFFKIPSNYPVRPPSTPFLSHSPTVISRLRPKSLFPSIIVQESQLMKKSLSSPQRAPLAWSFSSSSQLLSPGTFQQLLQKLDGSREGPTNRPRPRAGEREEGKEGRRALPPLHLTRAASSISPFLLLSLFPQSGCLDFLLH